MTRVALIAILSIGALNAFAGGVYGLMGADGIPRSWLSGSPFHDYFVPSLILFCVVGGSFALAAVATIRRTRNASLFARAAGVIALGWIGAQLAIIGLVSWLQPAVAIMGATIIALASAQRRSDSRRTSRLPAGMGNR